MPDLLLRLSVLGLVALLIAGTIWGGRLFVSQQRRQALQAAPLDLGGHPQESKGRREESDRVRVLAFSSADCAQCRVRQWPALQRLQALRGEKISIVEVDAPASPELTKRYHVLTVPSTVIIDSAGRAHAINYGFADTSQLLQQVDTAP